jgi:hypothetical protein
VQGSGKLVKETMTAKEYIGIQKTKQSARWYFLTTIRFAGDFISMVGMKPRPACVIPV